LHKILAESYLKYYCNKGIVRGVTLRLANVYGPGPRSSSKDRGIINQMIIRSINQLPLTVYGNGEFIRDYIYIDDVVEAFLSAAECIDKVNGQFFYIGTGIGSSILEMFNLIAERSFIKTGYKTNIQFVDAPADLSPIERRNFISNINKFVKRTSWKPRTNLINGIDSTISYFLNK
jgi:nucleoside-diphosphate-sugar epimerase